MLKAELHCHSNEDPEDYCVKYSAKELIEYYSKLNFDVVAITLHDKILFTKELVDFANKKGILLISGVEKKVEGKHVLIYNISKDDLNNITTFEDLIKLKKHNPNILVIAPHPFHPLSHSLGRKLMKYIDVFDAIEYSWYYCRWCNPNKKSQKVAQQYGKPMVGTADAHFLKYVESTYTVLDCDKNIESVFNAIKKGKVRIITNPLSLSDFVRYMLIVFWVDFRKLFKNIQPKLLRFIYKTM